MKKKTIWKKKNIRVQNDVTLLNQRDATHHPMLLTIEATGAKGHLISKRPFGVIVWTKRPMKKFDKFCPRIWKGVKS